MDAVFDEHGFRRSPSFAWDKVADLYAWAQSLGKTIIVNALVPYEVNPESRPRPEDIEWVLASYLLVRDERTYQALISTGKTEKGEAFLYDQPYVMVPEYFAHVGHPTSPMRREGGVRLREYSNGRAYVNTSNEPAIVTVPHGFVHLHGKRVEGQVTIPPVSGLILHGG